MHRAHLAVVELDDKDVTAELIGATLSEVRAEVSDKMTRMKQSASASLIVAGQRRGGPMRLFLVYPEGNFIEATEDTPYLQIGEHKYGKPILDRVITPETSLADAEKAVLLSMDSTLRSNLSVGMPLDLAVLNKGKIVDYGPAGSVLENPQHAYTRSLIDDVPTF